jgi:hypothetical protein
VLLGHRIDRRCFASAAFAVGIAAGCGTSDRPPAPSPLVTDAGETSGFTATAPVVQSCNLGPDGGVCACADEPLVGDPPTLYFVLDRSASMTESGKWPTIIQVLGQLVIALGPRAKIGAAVFPDPADQDSCTPGREVFAPEQGDAPAGTPGRTETAFLTTLGHIGANGGTPTAATLRNLLANRLRSLPGKTYVILATDGGPNCNDGAMCDVSSCGPNIEHVTADCPPAGPNNCCSTNQLGPELCLDAEPTEAAVTAIAAAGIPVYVVGVPGSAPYAALLDRLAMEGGTPRGGAAHQYYAVDSADQSAFSAAIFGIAAKITGSCTLTLSQAPPDPTLVNVFLDEEPLPQGADDAGGANWTIDGTTVTLLGPSCQKVLGGTVVDVRVVAGCPTRYR